MLQDPDQIHVMIDIEAYDIVPSAVILSIGAVEIVGDVANDSRQKFYVELDPTTQFERTVSLATKQWWAAQAIPVPIGNMHLREGLEKLTDFLMSFRKTPIIWCKGTDFDTAILSHAYNQMRLSIPWKYSNVRDCRTLFKIDRVPQDKNNSHNALDDAINQANHLLDVMVRLNRKLA